MAKPKDAKIEQCLRRIVREAVKQEEVITVKLARSRAEAELKLEAGFLKNDEEWKKRSKDIIECAFQESDASEPKTPKSTAVKEKSPTRQSKETSDAHGSGTKETKEPHKKSGAESRGSKDSEDGSDGSGEGSEDGSGDIESDEHGGGARTPEQVTPKRPVKTAPKANGVKRKASQESSSEAGSDSETEDESGTERPRQKKLKVNLSISSEEASEEGSSNEGEESEDEGELEEHSSPRSTSKATYSPAQGAITAISPKAFKPPAGYAALDSGLLAASPAFSQANLDGKQIWHITAPSGVPLSSISEIAVDAIQAGSPILTHKGAEYALHEDRSTSDQSATIVVPTANGYERIEQTVARSLQLQQIITLPHLTTQQASQVTGSSAAADIAEAAVSIVKPQPKGLRMRFKPPGFGAGKPGRIGSDSSTEDDEEQQPDEGPALQFPRTLGAHGKATEQSGADTAMAGAHADPGAEESDKEVKKKEKKKKRKEKEKDGPSTNRHEPRVNGVSKSISASSPPHAPQQRESYSPELSSKKVSRAAETQIPNGIASDEATRKGEKAMLKEEKRRRKEEKRQRKEAKRRAKEAPAE